MIFSATKDHVLNRGNPPDSFLEDLVTWGKAADDSIFAPNSAHDVYSSVAPVLGPWQGAQHRRAAMLEVLRVLAGFESSWNWNEGVDITNPSSLAHIVGQETGAWQVSFDSLYLDRTGALRNFVNQSLGEIATVQQFIDGMKSNHSFACGYVARLLRISVAWDGPVARGEIQPWLRRSAVAEFQALLT